MNKEQKLFEDIQRRTDAGELKWKLKGSNAHSDVVFQPNSVFRQFEASFEKDGESYLVVLVEKKYDDPEWDFALEKYKPELYFIHDNTLVLMMDEDVIPREQIINLVRRIEPSTDKAKKLLG